METLTVKVSLLSLSFLDGFRPDDTGRFARLTAPVQVLSDHSELVILLWRQVVYTAVGKPTETGGWGWGISTIVTKYFTQTSTNL